MAIKILLAVLILFVFANMLFALRVMLKGGDKPISYYLGRRLIFSCLVILLILAAMALGFIQLNPRPY